MSEIQAPAPLGPHADTLADPHSVIETGDGQALILYCARNRCGGIFDTAAGRWLMYVPIDFAQFFGLLGSFADDGDLVLPSGATLTLWVRSIEATLLQMSEPAND